MFEIPKLRKIKWYELVLIRLFGKKQWWGHPQDYDSALVIVWKNYIYAVSDKEVEKERAKINRQLGFK